MQSFRTIDEIGQVKVDDIVTSNEIRVNLLEECTPFLEENYKIKPEKLATFYMGSLMKLITGGIST